MPSQYAMELAALAWCKKETAHKVMDVELATAFAEILDEFLQSREAMTERVTRLKSHIDRIRMAVVEAVGEVDHPQGTYSSDVLGWRGVVEAVGEVDHPQGVL